MKNALYLVAGLALATTVGAFAGAKIKSVFIANGETDPVPVSVVGGAPSGGPPVYEFVGYSVAALPGGAPMPDRTQACQDTFGPLARWANTDEWFNSLDPFLPTSAPGAWIRPSNLVGDINTARYQGVCPGFTGSGTVIEAQWGNVTLQTCTIVWPLACSAPAP